MKTIWKPFGIAFASVGLLSLAEFFASGLVPEKYHGCMMICSAVFLWAMCLAVAAVRRPIVTQLAVAAGVSWGYLVMMSVAISMNNGRVSVNWPTMIPGLIAIPIIIQLTATPVYLISKFIHKKQIAEPTDGEASS